MREATATRRQFLQATAGLAGIVLRGSEVLGQPSSALRIDEPFHGAVLNHRHGTMVDGGLRICVSGQAPAQDRVVVNGVPALRVGTSFQADIVLHQRETQIAAVAQGSSGRQEHHVRVIWDRHSQPRYRFSIDDNSFFLRDIARQKYASLFDCFYLKGLRELHSKYGTRFVLNIYYTTEDGFELPHFPDRYKGEWRDSADWLRLAFHAHANLPDRPYQNAPPDRLIADLDQVAEQIVRFAGEQTYSPPTVIHWGMVQPNALKLLYERGVRVLSGYFQRQNAIWDINYLLDDVRSEYLSCHDALMDFESGIVFSRIDIVCNNTPVDQIVATLEPLESDPDQAEIMDLFTHEQYFWPFYSNYIADHFVRLDTTLRWITDHGYRPVFFHEGFLGGAV